MMPLKNTTAQPSLPLVFEEWRAIPGYEGYYEASNLGELRGLPRLVRSGNKGLRHKTLHLLKPISGAREYYVY